VHRQSVGVHSDDGCKFFDNTYGGVDYCKAFKAGDVLSVNYVKSTGTIFYTLNGTKLPDAYTGKFNHLEIPIYVVVGFDGPSEVQFKPTA
jgi:Ran-binding protein 9/10